MRRYFLNFHKSVRERAAEISARAYNHYKRIKPSFEKFYKMKEKYGKS